MAANWQYGWPVSAEVYGSGNGVNLGPFTHTVSFFPILPVTGGGTVVVKVTGSTVATDDGNGNLTGATIASGTVNYVTGACSITFTGGNAPPNASNNITINYNASTINTTPTSNDDIVFNLFQVMVAAGWQIYGNSDGLTFDNAAVGSPASQSAKILSRGTPANTTTCTGAQTPSSFAGSGTLNVSSSAGFPTSGTLIVEVTVSGVIWPALVSYTGTGTGTFTGCTFAGGIGGASVTANGNTVQLQTGNAGIIGNNFCWIRLRSPGTLGTTNGHEILFYHGFQPGSWYIGRSDTNFAGTQVSNTVGSASNGVNVSTFTGPASSILTANSSTAGFPAQGALAVATGSGTQIVYYSALSGSTFTGCYCAGSGVMSTGGSITSAAAAVTAPTASDQVGMFGSTAAPPSIVFTKAQFDNSTTSGTYHSEAAADANSPYGVYMFSFTKSPSANSAAFNSFIIDSLASGSYNVSDTNPYWYFVNAAGSVLVTPTATNCSAMINGTQVIDIIPLVWPVNFVANPYTGKDDLFPTYYYGNSSASIVSYKGQGYYYYIDSFVTGSRLPGTLLDLAALNDTVVCNTWCFPWNQLALLLG